MHAEIKRAQRQFLALYEQQRDYLAGKPHQYLVDLLHEAEELRNSPEFSERVGAEINRAAATINLGR